MRIISRPVKMTSQCSAPKTGEGEGDVNAEVNAYEQSSCGRGTSRG